MERDEKVFEESGGTREVVIFLMWQKKSAGENWARLILNQELFRASGNSELARQGSDRSLQKTNGQHGW